VQKEFNVFQLWVHDKNLTLNLKKKTETLRIAFHTISREPLKITAHSNKCLHEQTPLNWKPCFCSNSLKQVSHFNHSGLVIGENFNWQEHLKHLCKRIEHVLNTVLQLKIYFAYRYYDHAV